MYLLVGADEKGFLQVEVLLEQLRPFLFQILFLETEDHEIRRPGVVVDQFLKMLLAGIGEGFDVLDRDGEAALG